MIPALGQIAFHPQVSPDYLYRSAAQLTADEEREALEDFAGDLALIRNLPQTPATIRAII